jgi:hypothetical protein
MKIEADEKDLLESVERGEWKSAAGGKRETNSVRSLREGYIPEGPAAEHPAVEQGPRGDSEAGACGGLAVPDADRESAAQVRVRAAQRDLDSGLLNRSSEWCNESCDTSVAHRCTRGAAGAGATRATRDD